MSTAIVRWHNQSHGASLPKGIEPLEYPQPQAKTPLTREGNSVDVKFDSTLTAMRVTYFRLHEVVATRTYRTRNDVYFPSVAQRMLHEIDDWLHHDVQPLSDEVM